MSWRKRFLCGAAACAGLGLARWAYGTPLQEAVGYYWTTLGGVPLQLLLAAVFPGKPKATPPVGGTERSERLLREGHRLFQLAQVSYGPVALELYRDARTNYVDALTLDPSSSRAKRGLRRTRRKIVKHGPAGDVLLLGPPLCLVVGIFYMATRPPPAPHHPSPSVRTEAPIMRQEDLDEISALVASIQITTVPPASQPSSPSPAASGPPPAGTDTAPTTASN
jgi:hypothetical protein